MTPIQATLKTFVQCRPLWFWHIWGVPICLAPVILPLARLEYRDGALFSLLLVPLWCGMMNTSVLKDFLSKPFSIVVPRHQAVWRRSVFSIGLAVSIACSVVFLSLQTGSPWDLVSAVWQAFLLCLASYSVGVLLTAASPNTSFIPGVITLLMVASLDVDVTGQFRVSTQRILLASPFVTTVVSAVILVLAWYLLGARSFARKLSGEAFLPLHSTWSGNRQAIYNAERKLSRLSKAPGAVMRSMESFFLSRMGVSGRNPLRTTLWGMVYVLAGRAAPARTSYLLWGAIGFSVLTVAMGFYHPKNFPPGVSLANMIFFVLCAINAEYRITPHASLLLNTSRKNRLTSLMVASLAQLTVVAIMAGGLMLVSHAGGRFLHEITVQGNTWTYYPIAPKSLFLFTPLLPFFFIFQVLFPKQTVIPITVVSAGAVVLFTTSAEQLLDMSPIGLILLQVVSWLPFVAFVRHYCLFWDLKLDGQ